MDVTKLQAAKNQLATAIRLYFDDDDPISIHTLATAAGEIIDRLCESRGLPSMRDDLLKNIVADRRKEVVTALNNARNFFKHASGRSGPEEVLRDFSDERNLFAILMAADGLRLLGEKIPESRIFSNWLSVVEPSLFLNPPPRDTIEKIFGDIHNRPRREQKEAGRDTLRLAKTGALPSD